MTDRKLSRRCLLSSSALVAGALLTGCDKLNSSPAFRSVLASAQTANRIVHRSLGGSRMAMAHEYAESDISPEFYSNGTHDPDTAEYNASRARSFSDWRLDFTGLFDHPGSLSLDQLRALPQRTQITRHDCVEGWSAIGKWSGVPLKLLLDMAGLNKSANYIVFHCADTLSGARYYESIDLIDAFHPQSIIAHRLNNEALPVKNGAPLRLRVERQLGYKNAKYVQQIEAVHSLANVYGGHGGFWEDSANYAWYAGI